MSHPYLTDLFGRAGIPVPPPPMAPIPRVFHPSIEEVLANRAAGALPRAVPGGIPLGPQFDAVAGPRALGPQFDAIAGPRALGPQFNVVEGAPVLQPQIRGVQQARARLPELPQFNAVEGARVTQPAIGPEIVKQRLAPSMEGLQARLAATKGSATAADAADASGATLRALVQPASEAAAGFARAFPRVAAVAGAVRPALGTVAKWLGPVGDALGTANVVMDARDPNSAISQAREALHGEPEALWKDGHYAQAVGTRLRKEGALFAATTSAGLGLPAIPEILKAGGNFVHGLLGESSPVVTAAAATPTTGSTVGPATSKAATAVRAIPHETIMDGFAQASEQYPGLKLGQYIDMLQAMPRVSASSVPHGKNLAIEEQLDAIAQELSDWTHSTTATPAQKKAALENAYAKRAVVIGSAGAVYTPDENPQ